MNAADTTWMLVATALVLLMTPALAFFYGGLVRAKNALNTMMMSFVSLGCVGMAWFLLGYSLAFGPGTVLFGDLSALALRGVGLDPAAGTTIPKLLFMAYQGTFAIITAALISGAVVERMRFLAYAAFITLWSLVVYSTVAHWVWGGGFLARMGALDFAGGTVVHITAATAALVAAVLIGPRKDYARQAILPHNVPFTVLGAGLLWFGGFGFNGGSALAANGLNLDDLRSAIAAMDEAQRQAEARAAEDAARAASARQTQIAEAARARAAVLSRPAGPGLAPTTPKATLVASTSHISLSASLMCRCRIIFSRAAAASLTLRAMSYSGGRSSVLMPQCESRRGARSPTNSRGRSSQLL